MKLLVYFLLLLGVDYSYAILKQQSFDPCTKTCKEFYHYPCRSTSNVFRSFRQCQKLCGRPVSASSEDYKKYFYSPTTLSCEVFDYQHCKNNINLFTNPLDCAEKCQGNVSDSPCNLPLVLGPCYALIPRYYYDAHAGICKEFNYGGCNGNANNFENKVDCVQRCEQRFTIEPNLTPKSH
ncbi:unnamed protein product [Gordionus sp. m RMFG-2023]